LRVGVLALQGDVREHTHLLKDIGATPVAVRTPADLEQVDSLVLPGGESTTIGFMLAEHDMIEPLRKRIDDGMPAFGTCAGAILLAREVVVGGLSEKTWPKIGSLDIRIHRNAYGRQVDSFEDDVTIDGVGDVHAIFIRAPVIEATGESVTVLAMSREHPVVVRQGKILAATFHPELDGDAQLHRYFLEDVCS
jgi:pyridoxal 5'-phosphate synthase pdxT subunit